MTIVCGTDFSEGANAAARAAGTIAKRLGLRLLLAHAVESGAPADAVGRKLRELAAELAAAVGVEVEPVAVAGHPDEALVFTARDHAARLIVVASLGARRQGRWLLGSNADHIAQVSPVPVLVVRQPEAIESWARGDRPLEVVVAVEPTPASKGALLWADGLREIGSCRLTILQIAWPPGEHTRLGVPAPIPLDRLRPEVGEILLRDLTEWAGDVARRPNTDIAIRPGWGRVDAHIALTCAERKADLVVIGTHRRAGIGRLWHGSVSRGVLTLAEMNVACVPPSEADLREEKIEYRRILVPTDLSAVSNRAIPHAFAIVPRGGAIHLVHVVSPEADGHPDARESLRALIPPAAAERGIAVELEVVAGENAAEVIAKTAARLGVDAICMATRGRSGLSTMVLGSQAQDVLRLARQPILLIPPER